MNTDQLEISGLTLNFAKPMAASQLPSLAEWNQRYIEYVLKLTRGKKTAAARILGINRRTLYRRKKPGELAVDATGDFVPGAIGPSAADHGMGSVTSATAIQ